MKVKHVFAVTVECPSEREGVVYDVEMELMKFVPLEEILAFCVERPRYQEELTTKLAYHFGARVKTTGRHLKNRVGTACEDIGI